MHVVVAVDGSAASRRALTWAGREAFAHHGRLTVCWTGHISGPSEAIPDLEPDCQQFLVLGSALEDLVEVARLADLLVVGRPHERHFAVSPSGALARRVISQCGCPMLLVP
ncbi:MAG TPA: universal stress protein [Frankiaceae bacterium]|jgi:nucleotide-binding universal stress UspA family protein|nr:universal stress protein [Frankiaceae bacterium]